MNLRVRLENREKNWCMPCLVIERKNQRVPSVQNASCVGVRLLHMRRVRAHCQP
jgi:hypothetical protein